MYRDNDSGLRPSSYPYILGRALNEYRIKTSVTIFILGFNTKKSYLLEKIRDREAAKTARDMPRTKSDNKELEILLRLPEIARIIRTVFITEKKAALPWEMVTSKVSSTYTGLLLPKEHASHLNMLIKEVPGWATICKVQRRIYLKINRNTEHSEINTKLQAVIKAKR